MLNREFRFMSVPAMRVARFQVTGPTPEADAYALLQAWAGPKGYLGDPAAHPVYGFDNPEATEANPQHGYEFWISVGPEEQDPTAAYAEFPGGLYGVTECVLGDNQDDYRASWGRLEAWVKAQGYAYAPHQYLEYGLGDAPEGGFMLRLLLPVAKAT